MKIASVYLVRVNDERFVKVTHESYLKHLEENSTSTDKIWSEFDEEIYINGGACTVGETISSYGQKAVADMSGDSDTTPFTGKEESFDEAVILAAMAIGLFKMEEREAEAKNFQQEAKDKLNLIWERILEAMPVEQQKATPLLRKMNVLKGTTSDKVTDNIGRF